MWAVKVKRKEVGKAVIYIPLPQLLQLKLEACVDISFPSLRGGSKAVRKIGYNGTLINIQR